MTILKQKIEDALLRDLPSAKSHNKMLPPNRVLRAAPADTSIIKHSSVLLLLFPEGNHLKVCLIKRPAHMKHHAGQIALPGGRIEKGETATDAALRETFEEIGVRSKDIKILGKLSEFYVEVSRFQIQPIVAWLNTKPNFVINHDEVEKALFFPIQNFNAPYQEIELDTLTGKLTVPCIKFEGEIIWGATAMILSELYDVVKGCFN